MIKNITGNLLDLFDKGEFDAIAHGCNCFNTMGAGIAYSIANRYPDAYDADKSSVMGDDSKLGDYTDALYPQGTIINLYTQYLPGRNLDKDALIRGAKLLNNDFKGAHIGLPEIGCGIAGGNWDEISKLFIKHMPDVNITFVHFK